MVKNDLKVTFFQKTESFVFRHIAELTASHRHQIDRTDLPHLFCSNYFPKKMTLWLLDKHVQKISKYLKKILKKSNFFKVVRDMFGSIQDIFLDLSRYVSEIFEKIVEKMSKNIFPKNVPNYFPQLYPT